MRTPTTLRTALTAILVASGLSAGAQTVYRCGNLYSDAPCPGATAIDASDPRTPAQKAQTDAAARQSAVLANRMEKERHALEKNALRPPPSANRPRGAASSPRTGMHTVDAKPPQARQNVRASPEPFTATALVPPKPPSQEDPRKP